MIMSNRNQEYLKNLFETRLSGNSYDVDFNVNLYNTDDIKYYETDTLGQKRRFVPTMISDVLGEYINIPNSNTTQNNVAISFDVLVDTVDTLRDIDDTELEKVEYTNTLNAIEEFKSGLLAQYFPLGTPYLYMGGEDSKIRIKTSTSFKPNYMYMKFTPYNNDIENLVTTSTSGEFMLYKDETDIYFFVSGITQMATSYNVNEELEIEIYYDTNRFYMKKNGSIVDTVITPYSFTDDDYYIGGAGSLADNTGFEGILKRFILTTENVTTLSEVNDPKVDISTWNSKDAVTNSGSETLSINIISNSILWSESGNAVFSVGTTNPISDLRSPDGLYLYQTFEVEMGVVISNDVLFGNNFEYYLDGVQIYPVDRSHTLGTETNFNQKFNENYNKGLVEESMREHTTSFYYIPSKQLTNLLKHVVSGDTAQNTAYELVVQFPFFQVTYDVLVDSGGTNPNINTIATFTVTFKRKAT